MPNIETPTDSRPTLTLTKSTLVRRAYFTLNKPTDGHDAAAKPMSPILWRWCKTSWLTCAMDHQEPDGRHAA
jgi:hypothetical protein